MIPGPALWSGKSPPDFPEWSPLGSLGFGLGPSPEYLSRCFSRNAGVTVVLSCAPTLLCTVVSCSHFITFPLCPMGHRPKEYSEWWNLPPPQSLCPLAILCVDPDLQGKAVSGQWWNNPLTQDRREMEMHRSAGSLLCWKWRYSYRFIQLNSQFMLKLSAK